MSMINYERLSRVWCTWVLGCVVVLVAAMLGSASPASAKLIYIPGVSFGSEGSGNGQFKEPVGVAVNDSSEPLVQPAAGDVYVVDKGNDRVERFSSTGTYLGQFNGSGTYEVIEGGVAKVEHGTAAPTGAFSAPEEVAVDNSNNPLDPSVGDVYVLDNGHDVVDKFSATGAYLGQLNGGRVPPASFVDVTVDPSGNVWTLDTGKNVEECVVSTGVCEKKFTTGLAVGARGLAVDSKQNIYIHWADIEESENGHSTVVKLNSATGAEAGSVDGFDKGGTTFAINPSTNNIVVDKGSSIALYGPFGEPYNTPPLETFATEGFSESYGIGVGGAGTVYASERGANKVETFVDVPLPTVVTETPSSVSETAMTLNGTVNPEGEPVTECYFEYGTEPGKYTNKVACEQEPQTLVGSAALPVGRTLSGLPAANVRSVRLVAANANGTLPAAGVTVSHPTTAGETFSNVSVIAATFSAQVDPGGLATKYRVEYGTSTSYGTSTPEESIGSANEGVAVRVSLTGLQPGTQYHLRVVASNVLGTVDGPDVTFATYLSVAGLPDGRVYEPVSPVGFDQDVNIYIPGANYDLTAGIKEGSSNAHGINADPYLPFQAAVDGEAVVYAGDPPPTGGTSSQGEGKGNEYLATRSPGGGWTQVAIETGAPLETAPIKKRGAHAQYRAFTSDLSVGILEGPIVPVTGAPLEYHDVYAHAMTGGVDGGYESLFTTVPDRTGEELKTAVNSEQAPYAGANAGTGMVRAYSHLLFESNADLLEGEGQLEQEVREDVRKEVEARKHGELSHYLYDHVGGKLYLVDVLPDGSVAAGGAFGSIQGAETVDSNNGGGPDFTRVISADGSRVVWTYAPEAEVEQDYGVLHRSRALYVRENDTQPQSPVGPEEECLIPADACTVQVDKAVGGEGIFQGASTDGSKVFFTKGDLYEYDLENGQTTDLSPGVEVKGVAGISENGEYVYYVDSNNNIVLWHAGVTTRVATGAATSDDDVDTEDEIATDYAGEIGSRTAEVTPDGHSLVFMSGDNVYLYEVSSGKLTCVSCDPTGEAQVPTNASTPLSSSVGAVLPISRQATYQPRWISEDGSRVFFESAQPLVPQATNGWLNVYEWERDGTGSCQQTQGCIFLLSSGSDPENSYLLDVSANGNDVFIITRAQLVAQDRNDLDDVYDVRVGGVRPGVAPECSGTDCQGVPPAPPIFATPASVTFEGIGNFAAPLPASRSGSAKARSAKCKKGFVKKNGRCVEKRRAKRARRAAGKTGRSSGRSRGRI